MQGEGCPEHDDEPEPGAQASRHLEAGLGSCGDRKGEGRNRDGRADGQRDGTDQVKHGEPPIVPPSD